jgi:hypothetical protein
MHLHCLYRPWVRPSLGQHLKCSRVMKSAELLFQLAPCQSTMPAATTDCHARSSCLPTYLPHLPACLPACLPDCLTDCLTDLLTDLLTACLPACLPAGHSHHHDEPCSDETTSQVS